MTDKENIYQPFLEKIHKKAHKQAIDRISSIHNAIFILFDEWNEYPDAVKGYLALSYPFTTSLDFVEEKVALWLDKQIEIFNKEIQEKGGDKE